MDMVGIAECIAFAEWGTRGNRASLGSTRRTHGRLGGGMAIQLHGFMLCIFRGLPQDTGYSWLPRATQELASAELSSANAGCSFLSDYDI